MEMGTAVTMRWTSRICSIAVLALATLTACTGNSAATTARFEVGLKFSNLAEPANPVPVFKGVGDFATGELSYIMSFGTEREVLEFGNSTTYQRDMGEEQWTREEDPNTPAKPTTSFRNHLAATSNSLKYLTAVADPVTEVGTETVRGVTTAHYRASVNLARVTPSPDDERLLLEVEVWVDEDGRTRRYSYSPLASPQEIYVWEFFDFGIPVDLEHPSPDEVRA